MKKVTHSLLLAVCLLTSVSVLAQNKQLVQNIKGIVVDRSSGAPLPFITVGLTDMPEKGTMTNDDGSFILENVPVGRHDIQASSVGYETNIVREIMLTSAKEVYLEIQLKENVQQLGEVVITAQAEKNEPLNKMALFGGHMLNVEEAARYAGSLDDPARLVSAFAGVSPGVANNGISVHGNAPSLLQWRLEDIEIPNPNHFADVSSLGGGILSSLSSNVLGNSDFFTSAFPAEYSNAVSGVFDMKLRNGNNQKFQHTFQAGIMGLDFASEGPISKKHNSSYIFNYRYSTTGLMSKINPAGDLEQVLDYQDLNFKLNFPTKNAGVFSLWGTALKDNIKPEIKSPEEWEYQDDAKDSRMKQTSAAVGLSHRYFFNNNAQLKTTIAATYSDIKAWEDVFDVDMNSTPSNDFNSKYTNLVFTSYFNKKYSSKHTNKTGFTVTNMRYDMNMQLAPFFTEPLETIMEGKGNTNLLTAYTSSLFNFNDKLSATLGINGQLLTLNNSWTIEPRAALKWQASAKSTFGLAYGLHSRMEKMDVYFVKTKVTGDELVNKDLDFTKTHHFSLSYSYKIADDMNLRIEPYFQYLYDVPVIADSSFSILNRSKYYVEDALVNKGNGRNFGIDLTFEKYMTKGMYYMINASIFSSKYRGGDGVWHSTKYNRNYIINGLFGKEWMIGRSKQNVFGVNVKLTLQGGDRYSPVDEKASLAHPDKETQYDETQAYSKQLSTMFLGSYTVSYRMNRKKVSHEIAVKGANALGYKEYFGHEYNLQTHVIEPKRIKNSIFNVVYRLDF
ncbi:carboxypeptidase-like regulatory domain-containing protein [Prevotella sp. 10(H)]|uniref:TonB-dependent receptor n=1 Tax=Prevotella sp. 10(H) TaxID=1158294 RepID=UPI0004A6F6FA|nr:carboxypeptidase-like regulatory domain-containing protein [Prevotella sp. 10(H)]